MADEFDRDWWLCQTQPRQEFMAAAHLARQKYQCLVPHVMKVVRHARTTSERQRPLFPGYVFVSAEGGFVGARSINGTRGVSRLVAFDAHGPAVVPPSVIRDFLSKCDESGLIIKPPSVEIGDHVNAISGPLAGIVARVIGLPERDRVQVLLEMMGQHVKTTLSLTSVLKVARP